LTILPQEAIEALVDRPGTSGLHRFLRRYRALIAEWVLHVDLDQFLAAVEIRRRPELTGRPVIVGGDGNPRRPRQVVATASYEARAFGVRSGMPLATALRKCPDGVFLPHDRPAYDAASAEVMATLRTFPVVVEVWGWDEAFLAAITHDPEALAADIKARVFAETGLTCAVGIGDSRLTAKTATGVAPPGGIARLTRSSWFDVMGDRPATSIWGIGDRTAARLEELGVRTVRELAAADLALLRSTFGPAIGAHLKVLGLGGGDEPIVDEPWIARSRSHEETFEQDVASFEDVQAHVVRMAAAVTREVAAQGRVVTHVAVKLRTSSFFTRTKIGKLPEPTTDPDAVAAHARVVLSRFELGRPLRLIGVRVMLDMNGAS
jgi:DNA polymerase-4